MMQQRIVAEPSLPQQLIDDTIALSMTADHIRTLVDCCGERLKVMRKWAESQPAFSHYAEWPQMEHLLSMIAEKADQVERVSHDVRNA